MPFGTGRPLSSCSPRSRNSNLPVRGATGRGRLRDEHLAAVPGRADAGGAVDVEADVAALGRGRLAGVDRPSVRAAAPRDGHSWRGKRTLCVDRRVDGVPGARERDEELVAAAVDLVAAERL